jgi:hypothetical protein
MNSLHRILLTTLTILATSTFLYLLWKSFSFIGHPLGRCLANLINKLSDDGNMNNITNDDDNTAKTKLKEQQKFQKSIERTSSILGAMLGFFLFITLFPLALEGSDEIPSQWRVEGGGEGERLVSALLWVGWIAVRCWGETVVVLAVLAGVVKVLRLDAADVEGVGCEEKDLKRNS